MRTVIVLFLWIFAVWVSSFNTQCFKQFPVISILLDVLENFQHFYRYVFTRVCQSFCSQGASASVHAGIPPEEQTPPPPPPSGAEIPGSRHTSPPREQTPPRSRHLPAQSMLGDTVNARAVRILLECNLVQSVTAHMLGGSIRLLPLLHELQYLWTINILHTSRLKLKKYNYKPDKNTRSSCESGVGQSKRTVSLIRFFLYCESSFLNPQYSGNRSWVGPPFQGIRNLFSRQWQLSFSELNFTGQGNKDWRSLLNPMQMEKWKYDIWTFTILHSCHFHWLITAHLRISRCSVFLIAQMLYDHHPTPIYTSYLVCEGRNSLHSSAV